MNLSLTYDDIALVNRDMSTLESRFQPSTAFQTLSYPMMASPMDTVCEEQMAIALNRYGLLGILHRFCTLERQAEMLNTVLQNPVEGGVNNVGIALGISGDYPARYYRLMEIIAAHGSNWNVWICFDTANGFSVQMERALIWYNTVKSPDHRVIAGNVCSYEGTKFLANLGVGYVRLGIGNGSPCTTSRVTGFGQGIASVILEARRVPNVCLIADGGIRETWDVAKALALGAHIVMAGSLFAGFDESPGEIQQEMFPSVYNTKMPLGAPYKIFRGMASHDAAHDLQKLTNNRKKIIAEGVSHKVLYKGSLDNFLPDFLQELKISLSFGNSRNLSEFHNYFDSTPDAIVQVTPNSFRERGAFIKDNGLL